MAKKYHLDGFFGLNWFVRDELAINIRISALE